MIKSVQWLSDHLSEPEIVILDASLPAKKARIHQIPGSRFFDLKQDFSDISSKYPNTMPSEAQFQASARNLGINQKSIVVVYDNIGIYSSARVWYMFRSMGHEQVYVLDGGLPEWLNHGYQVEKPTEKTYNKGDFEASFDESSFCDIDLVKQNINNEKAYLVDARSAGRFQGSAPEPRPDLQSGHIPKSINIPYTEVLENGKFKSTKELGKIFNQQKPLIFSCGSGITACILMLASELAGNEKDKKVYDGSWTQWAMNHELFT